MHDLLSEPIISVCTGDGDLRLSLPQLLAALSAGKVTGYPRLRPHQMDPFHVLTVQLAASILGRRHLDTPPADAAFWREGLLELADNIVSAWHLVEADPTRPAFMQSPCARVDDFKSFKTLLATPDKLDVLITSKDHSVKAERASAADIELWLYALAAVQTIGGYLIHYQASARMNSGTGSRAVISTISDTRPAARFLEELPIVIACRTKLIADGIYGYRTPGIVLTWLCPRPLTQSQFASFRGLEPLFVEAVRPVRLTDRKQAIEARTAIDVPNQIGLPKNAQAGITGDPWTALNENDKKKGSSALTVGPRGFDPELLTNLLFEQRYRLTPLQRPRTGSGSVVLRASVLVRGQGTTDGFHEVELPVPERARLSLLDPAERSRLAEFAQSLLNDAATIRGRCLRSALIALAEGGPETADQSNDTVARWVDESLRTFGRSWQTRFFPALWAAAAPDANEPQLRAQWVGSLVEQARKTLREGTLTIPVPVARRVRAQVRAIEIFEHLLRKHGLYDLMQEPSDDAIA